MASILSVAAAVVTGLVLTMPSHSVAAPSKKTVLKTETAMIQSYADIRARIDKEGLQAVLEKANWDSPELKLAKEGKLATIDQQSTELTNECVWNRFAPGCGGAGVIPDPVYYYGSDLYKNFQQLKDDGLQIIATEVMYQTLTHFKVKHAFGKMKRQSDGQVVWLFAVVEPKEGQPFQDLDTADVVYAIGQFRKYIAGLLCNTPDDKRVLGMMNAYNLGERFRWDMAWALLGNDLPEAPNKWMRFGPKWQKFSAAMDGIENGSLLRLKNLYGQDTTVNPLSVLPVEPPNTPPPRKIGFIAKEVAGIIRLVGDIVQQILDLFCKSDLSFDRIHEAKKKESVMKLLEIKKKAHDRYAPLRGVLEELAKKAEEATGRPFNFMP